jgi:hypothetical protein
MLSAGNTPPAVAAPGNANTSTKAIAADATDLNTLRVNQCTCRIGVLHCLVEEG